MRSVKSIGIAAVAGLAGVVLFDLAAFLAFPGLVQRLNPDYAVVVPQEARRAARENPYFVAREDRGFDIAPGVRSVFWQMPDLAPHAVWGNSLGCFDDEPPEGRAPDIYLAGDSFTWGFSPHESQFGTILERETGLLVLACGVPNTGQRHQFAKFAEIAGRLPDWPGLAIVNVFANDIANDHAHPHATAVGGALVDTAFVSPRTGEVIRAPLTGYGERFEASGLKYFLKTYSATANVVNAILRDHVRPASLDRMPVQDAYESGSFPIRSDIAAAHRAAVAGWITHARRHGYALRFALIPGRDDFGRDVYGAFREWLARQGGVAWDFESHAVARHARPEALYWPVNYHFNPEGHAAYAAFLIEMLRTEARAGTLPRRLAPTGQPGRAQGGAY